MSTSITRRTAAAALGLAAALVLAACSNPDDGGTTEVAATSGSKMRINISPDQKRITTDKVDSIAAEVPQEIRERGTLELVQSSGSAAPLNFHATDNKTLIGIEPDIAHLVADVLGLKPKFHAVSWENIFVGLDSAKYDAGFSNITVTEERKEKYDFATYRQDNLGFEAKKGSGLKISGPKDVAGKTVAVQSGTNQEKLLVEWSKENEQAKPQAGEHQVLPERQRHLPRPPVRPDRRLPRSQPDRRVPRGHHREDRGRRYLLRQPAQPSRASSRPPPRRTAAWSSRSPTPSTTSSRTAPTRRRSSAGACPTKQ